MKTLLNCTAIAGIALAMTAAPAAAEIDLGLGGHFSAYGIFADQDADDIRSFDFQREAEIYFTGETTLDNGLTVGAEIQLEGETDGDDQIDESYLYMSGDWGRVNLGSENGAAYLLQVGAPAVDGNFDGIDPEYVILPAPGTNVADFNYGMSIGGNDGRGDTDKITYLSPVFSGFQVGVSYSPSVVEDGDIRAGVPTDNDAGEFENAYQVGARWAGEFEGVGLTAGAGWAQADLEAPGVGPGTVDDDRELWNVGVNANFAGFTVGASYFEDNNGFSTDGDTETWAFGANYETGPYTVGASYADTQTETGATTEDEAERILVGGSYAYGPGMSFNGAVHFYDFDGATAADDEDATMVTVGTVVKF